MRTRTQPLFLCFQAAWLCAWLSVSQKDGGLQSMGETCYSTVFVRMIWSAVSSSSLRPSESRSAIQSCSLLRIILSSKAYRCPPGKYFSKNEFLVYDILQVWLCTNIWPWERLCPNRGMTFYQKIFLNLWFCLIVLLFRLQSRSFTSLCLWKCVESCKPYLCPRKNLSLSMILPCL